MSRVRCCNIMFCSLEVIYIFFKIISKQLFCNCVVQCNIFVLLWLCCQYACFFWQFGNFSYSITDPSTPLSYPFLNPYIRSLASLCTLFLRDPCLRPKPRFMQLSMVWAVGVNAWRFQWVQGLHMLVDLPHPHIHVILCEALV